MENIVNIEELSSSEYKISIRVPPVIVDKKVDDFFNSIKKSAEVPGFRKGKAPIARLRQLYGHQSRPTVVQMLVSEYYNKAIKDSDITPIGNPRVDEGFIQKNAKFPGKFGFDNSFSIDLIAEVLPKIDPQGYIGIDLDIPDHDEKALFDRKMLGYREQFAEKNQITDRGAELGDLLVIDFAGFMDGEQFPGGSANGHTIDSLGSSNFIPGFEEQIVGIKAGETKQIKVKFPEEYPAQHLAGKDASFDITVHSIVETKLADINEDLAMMVGYESVEELNNHVQEESKKEKARYDKVAMDRQIIDKLLEANEFDAPLSMIKGEEQRILKASGNEHANLPEDAQKEITKLAEFNVKRAIIMDAIYEKEDSVEVTPEELNKLLEEHAKANNQSKDELVSNLYNSGQMDNFVGVLRVSNVLEFITNNANKESEEVDDSQ